MASESTGETVTVRTEEAGAAARKKEWKCHSGDHPIPREDVRKAFEECQHESFWYRALPLSAASMAVTGGLIYNGVWKSSQRFGPFPKLAVAGILGFVAGKASYISTCRSKFQALGIGPGSGSWAGQGGFGPWGRGPGRRCHHVCEECKKKPETAAAEQVKS